jgi:nucleotide-binding universal stress UspA family protein
VLTVHEPVVGPVTATRVGGALMSRDLIDRTLAELAQQHVDEAQATADAGAQAAVDAGLRATTAVAGDRQPWRAVLAATADVIVCGSRGGGAVARFVLGSTSSSLLHHADRPVLVVPDAEMPAGGPALIGYDGSDVAGRAIAETARLLPGRPALVVHAWSSPFHRSVSGRMLRGAPVGELREITGDVESWMRESAEATAAEGAELARSAGLEATSELAESDPTAWRALAAAAEARQAAVVVIGAQGKGRASSVLLGSVSAGLVHHAERPVLVTR